MTATWTDRLVVGLLAVGAASALAVSLGGPAQVPKSTWVASAAGSSGAFAVTASRSAAAPGSELTVTATGFAPGSTVRVTLGPGHNVLLAAQAAGTAGNVNASVRVPAAAAPGPHVVTLAGVAPGGAPLTDQLALRVT
jgi:hypothetical protein